MRRRFLSAAFGLALMMSFGTAMGVEVPLGVPDTIVNANPGADTSYGIYAYDATHLASSDGAGGSIITTIDPTLNTLVITSWPSGGIVGDAADAKTYGIYNEGMTDLKVRSDLDMTVTAGTLSTIASWYRYNNAAAFTGSITNTGTITLNSVANTTQAAGLAFTNVGAAQNMNGTINLNNLTVNATNLAATGGGTGILASTVGTTASINVTGNINITADNTGPAVTANTASLEGMTYDVVNGDITVGGTLTVETRNTGTFVAGSAIGVSITTTAGSASVGADSVISIGNIVAKSGTMSLNDGNVANESYAAAFFTEGNVEGKIIGGSFEATSQSTGNDSRAEGVKVKGELIGEIDLANAKGKSTNGAANGVSITGGITDADAVLKVTNVSADATNGAATGIKLGEDWAREDSSGTITTTSIVATTHTGNAMGLFADEITGATSLGTINATIKIGGTGNATGVDVSTINAGNNNFTTGNIVVDAKGTAGAAAGIKVAGAVSSNAIVQGTMNVTSAAAAATGMTAASVGAGATFGADNNMVIAGTSAADGQIYGINVTGNNAGTIKSAGVKVTNNGAAGAFGIHAAALTGSGSINSSAGDIDITGHSNTANKVYGVGTEAIGTGTITTGVVKVVNDAAGTNANAIGVKLIGLDIASNKLVTNGAITVNANGGEADGINAGSLANYDINANIIATSTSSTGHGIHTTTTTAGTNSTFNMKSNSTVNGSTVGILAAGASDTLNFDFDGYTSFITTNGVENVQFFEDSTTTLDDRSNFAGTTKVWTEDGSKVYLNKENLFAGATYDNDGYTKLGASQTFTKLTGDDTGVIDINGWTATMSNPLAVDTTTYKGLLTDTSATPGIINKTGAGRLILTSDKSTFGGITNIAGPGGITITDGNSLGTSNINIANTADLTMTFDTDETVVNKISGAGVVNKGDNGTATLTNANNTWSGGLNINKGNVIATSAGAVGQSDIHINATDSNMKFIIAPGLPQTYGKNITGPGSLTKEGAGTLIHTGNITNVSPFNINAGEWNGQNSLITGTTTNVGSLGTLTASGQQGLTFDSTSVVDTALGGTLKVGTTKDANPGGSDSEAAKFHGDLGTTVTINKGTKLEAASTITGNWNGVFDTDFTSSWLAGTGWNPDELEAYLASQSFVALNRTNEWLYDGSEIDLNAVTYDRDTAWDVLPDVLAGNRAADFLPLVNQNLVDNILLAQNEVNYQAILARGFGNEIAAANLLRLLGTANSNLPDPEGYSGYRYATGMDLANTLEAVQDTAKAFTRAIGARAYNLGVLTSCNLDECGQPIACGNQYKTRIWAGYSGLWGKAKDRLGDRGYSYDANGFNVGLDHLTSSGFAFGTAFGYSKGDYKLNSVLWDSSNIDNYSFGLYGSYNHASGFFATLLGQYTYSDYDINSQFSNHLTAGYNRDHANYESNTWAVGGALGWDIKATSRFTITPSIGIYYYDTFTKDFNTYNDLNTVNRYDMKLKRESVEMPIDLTMKYDVCASDNTKVSLVANGGYSYNFKNKGTKIEEFNLGGVSLEGGQYSRKPGSSTWYAGGGIQASIKNFDIGANYEYVGRYDYHSHNVTATVGVKF